MTKLLLWIMFILLAFQAGGVTLIPWILVFKFLAIYLVLYLLYGIVIALILRKWFK